MTDLRTQIVDTLAKESITGAINERLVVKILALIETPTIEIEEIDKDDNYMTPLMKKVNELVRAINSIRKVNRL